MSSRKSTLCSPFIRATLQLTACIATVLSVLFLCNIPATAKITYAIDNGEQQLIFSSNATELSAVLDEAGVAHSELDLVDTATEDGVISLSITPRQYVTVVCDGVTTSMLTNTSDTVADVLAHLNIELAEFDQVSAELDAVLDGAITEISVNRATVTYETERTLIPYESIREASTEMPRGEEAVTTDGVDGTLEEVYRTVTMEDGTSTTDLFSVNTIAPVNEVVSYGTKTEYQRPTNGLSTSSEYITNIDDEAGTFTTSKGDTYSFSKVDTLNATAYTARPGAICSTGRVARVGVVAVDPKYIPYGTEMFIMSEDGSFVYGLAIAGDCGGAIDNNDVDLYMNSRNNCIQFGRRNLTAFIIESED